MISDEAERLIPMALDPLGDWRDREHLANILTGMPDIDQRFRYYVQLYSRLSFAVVLIA
ncbi:hypothetical protein CMMCAS02_00305 [Clavibacter michiganensis subsp. michiganensis]|nr:hypothetical protein DOU02_11715 [Clavibacter michiganensis subsp. michiganensis]OUD81339.1 hypothetical protein CMMCAS02_00305 [Clavibacter michiganensis subsp. michiganensis]OUD90425.1 hypothetical protein CMMCAS03_09910 [Clavibacter michiganensis subsp. michiganensis]OUE14568.1 hypothetical protein CMMCA002_00290 [Clavibacter michiganensis subsp. michiganensis]